MLSQELIEALREFRTLKDAVIDDRHPDHRQVQQAVLAGMYAIAVALAGRAEEEEDEDD